VLDDLGEDQAGQEEVDGGGGEPIDLGLGDESAPRHHDRDENDEEDDRYRGHRVGERRDESLDHGRSGMAKVSKMSGRSKDPPGRAHYPPTSPEPQFSHL
jgi:hypothetical protein